MYYLKYDGKTRDGRITTTYFGNNTCDIDNIISKLAMAAVNAGITLDELINKVSHEFTNDKFNVSVYLIKFYSHKL